MISNKTGKDLTPEKAMSDFKKAYGAKRKLIEREEEDFLFALGKQWTQEDVESMTGRKIKVVTDNRIAPNIFLLTGLERQNRTDFKAFPEGQEDSVKAEIATILLKNANKISDFSNKSSEQFKDGVTCGESHLELYLDYTYNILNGVPVWKKTDGDCLFPEPGYREYDFSDARYVYKLTKGLSADDLISLYPDKKNLIESSSGGKIDFAGLEASGTHRQPKDYPKANQDGKDFDGEECGFDLLERVYKKYVEQNYIGDRQTGEIKESETKEKAQEFVTAYQDGINQEQQLYQQQLQQSQQVTMATGVAVDPPPLPPQQNLDRYVHFTRHVPEIWIYAFTNGIDEPLADERAWFYPKWKSYPFVPYFCRFSTAPIEGDDRHLLIQGVVHGVKNAQEIHNKASTLELLHLNTSTNSGWLSEENSWVDVKKVEKFGASPGINLEYKKGSQPPSRLFPNQLSAGHEVIAQNAAESIKAQLGINADLLAVQEGSQASGRAIALRQRQGLLMVQEPFDNLSRTRKIAASFLLSQMGEIYDTESAKKILGDAFLIQNFPPMMQQIQDPVTGQVQEVALPGKDGQPMRYDEDIAEVTIAEVLSGKLEKYDVSVGESVSSETTRIANMQDLKEFATALPGIITPDVLIEESQLPQATKSKVLANIKQQQAMQAAMAGQPPMAA